MQKSLHVTKCVTVATVLFLIAFPLTLYNKIAIAEKPYTSPKGSLERKAIVDALRVGCTAKEIVFVVNHLKVKDGWAWIETNPQTPDGKNKLKPFNALLHKEESKWIIKRVHSWSPALLRCVSILNDITSFLQHTGYISKINV